MSGSVLVQIDPEKPGTIDGDLIDLSFDGVGMYSPKQLIEDTTVKFLVINRQLNVNIGGLARVVFCKAEKYNDKDSYRVGLEFVSVDQRQVRATLKDVKGISADKRN